MPEKSKAARFTKNPYIRTIALIGVVSGLAVSGKAINDYDTAPKHQERRHSPAVAGPILANRVGSCVLTNIKDLHQPPKENSLLKGKDMVSFSYKVAFAANARPYYGEYVADNGVIWQDEAFITRSHVPKGETYLPASTMSGYAQRHSIKNGKPTGSLDRSADGVVINGTLAPSLDYAPGSFVDIWTNESTTYRNEEGRETTAMNAAYCGRMIMQDAAGEPTWQLDRSGVKPLQDVQPQIVSSLAGSFDQDQLLLPFER